MTKAPKVVVFLQEALAERMGRPAAIRSVKGNPSQWFIFDPSFSVLQRGAGSNPRGYRSGIYVDNNDICFYNVHSRTPAMLLRRNLLQQPSALLIAAERSRHLRSSHYLHFSSRARCRGSEPKRWSETVRIIESSSWREFKDEIIANPSALIRDMFPALPTAGRIGTGTSVRGSDFCLLLADCRHIELAESTEVSADKAADVIDAAWHLFACLYPWDSPKTRVASLRRAMHSTPGLLECEYSKIANSDQSPCDGSTVEAAHIVPHAKGGCDRYWNGTSLCSKHHRMTEGRIAGIRSRTNPLDLSVRLVLPPRDL